MVRDDLPNDIESLKDLVLAHSAEVEHLKLVIQKLQRLSFGRRSEKLEHEIEQLEFRLEELQIAEAPAVRIAFEKSPAPTPVRRPLPEHLPRTRIEHMPRAQGPGNS